MKQIDNLDSLQHLNFPNSSAKREKFGSFLLAVFGLVGLFIMTNPQMLDTNNGTMQKQESNKFWLTPTSLNAEQTAFHTTSIQSEKAGFQKVVSANAAATKTLSH